MVLEHAMEITEQSKPKADGLIDVRLTAVHYSAEDTKLYELRRTDDGLLPSIDPGAHMDVHLPNGIIRQYSLLIAEQNPSVYAIGVKRDEKSRGGSRYMHETLQVGADLKISWPRNNFPLYENARHSVFIAGGIGITPIWCMLNRLNRLGRSWQLYYSCRSARQAIFFNRLMDFPQVKFHFDDENDGRFLDLSAIIRSTPDDAHIYCCGPAAMMAAFEHATAEWNGEQLHVEYFSPRSQNKSGLGFVVELARSGRVLAIPPDKSILDALRDAGVNLAYSCEQGICGTCETQVVAGIPDHRDAVLSEQERASNTTMMICCSRSLTDRLVLDI